MHTTTVSHHVRSTRQEVYSGWDGWGPHTCVPARVTAGDLRQGDVIALPGGDGVDFWVKSAWVGRDGVHLTLIPEGAPQHAVDRVHAAGVLVTRTWTSHP